MRTPPPEQPVQSEQDATGAAHHVVAYATAGVALSAAAGLIHLWVAPEHFHEAWLVGAFFVSRLEISQRIRRMTHWATVFNAPDPTASSIQPLP